MRHRSASAVLFAVIQAGFAAFAKAQSSGARSTALSTQDYIDIQQLYAGYAVLIDTGDADGWANTFTPDGVFNNSSQGHDRSSNLFTTGGTSGAARACDTGIRTSWSRHPPMGRAV